MADATESGSNRQRKRAVSEGKIWLASSGQLIPAGQLLDLSEGGLRYRHDPRALGADGFPISVPEAGQTLQLALTIHASESPHPFHAQVLRAAQKPDGSIEVACQFEAQDAREALRMHRQFVDASLQRARQNLSSMRAKLFHEPVVRRRGRVPLGKILTQRQAIDRTDLNRFINGNRSGVPLGERLVKAGLVSGRQLAEALSEHVGLPFVDLEAVGVDAGTLRSIRPGTALRLGAVAFARSRGQLKVAAPRPLSAEERLEIERQAHARVRCFLADPEQIAGILRGTEGGRSRRARFSVLAQLRVQYRFYSVELQQLDAPAFHGDAVNLSQTGILVRGPAPVSVAEAFRKRSKPRLLMAMRIQGRSSAQPMTLRFEPVRIDVFSEPGKENPSAPQCWIGARVSPVLPEDRKNLVKLCAEFQTL